MLSVTKTVNYEIQFLFNSLPTTVESSQPSCPSLWTEADSVAMTTLPLSPARPAPAHANTSFNNQMSRNNNQTEVCVCLLTCSSVPSSISQDSQLPLSCRQSRRARTKAWLSQDESHQGSAGGVRPWSSSFHTQYCVCVYSSIIQHTPRALFPRAHTLYSP